MRVLIVGATGQIGSHLAAACNERGFEVLGTYHRRPHHQCVQLDLCDAAAVRELVSDYRPDVVFHAAGLTCAGYAEAYPEECERVIVGGIRALAEAVRDCDGTLVAFGSDEVFGDCQSARKEDAAVTPLNNFAEAHAAAEAIIRAALPGRHLILRTSMVYGPDGRGHNLALTMLKKFRRGDGVAANPASHGHPTYAPDLAEVAVELVRSGEVGTVPPPRGRTGTPRSPSPAWWPTSSVTTATWSGRPPRCTRRGRRAFGSTGRKLRGLLGKAAIRTAADGLRWHAGGAGARGGGGVSLPDARHRVRIHHRVGADERQAVGDGGGDEQAVRTGRGARAAVRLDRPCGGVRSAGRRSCLSRSVPG